MSPHRRPLPPDPRVRALIAQAARPRSSSGLSRRQFLAAALGTVGTSALLAACGTGGIGGSASASATRTAATDVSATDKIVRWASWTLYLDQNAAGTSYPTLDAFMAKTGIKATYAEDIDDNDSFYGKISGQLANGQDIGYDIVTLTDWMAARMIRLGYTQKFDNALIPNAANILPNFANVDFDPGRTHSLTWQSGFGGLAWAKD